MIGEGLFTGKGSLVFVQGAHVMIVRRAITITCYVCVDTLRQDAPRVSVRVSYDGKNVAHDLTCRDAEEALEILTSIVDETGDVLWTNITADDGTEHWTRTPDRAASK